MVSFHKWMLNSRSPLNPADYEVRGLTRGVWPTFEVFLSHRSVLAGRDERSTCR